MPVRSAETRPGRLPGSDELFRRTTPLQAGPHETDPYETGAAEAGTASADRRTGAMGAGMRVVDATSPASGPPTASVSERRPTGRERHDEKITVYVSNDELIDLEHARLTLKRLGVKADRGRIVREAMAELISDLELNGDAAVLVRRLRPE